MSIFSYDFLCFLSSKSILRKNQVFKKIEVWDGAVEAGARRLHHLPKHQAQNQPRLGKLDGKRIEMSGLSCGVNTLASLKRNEMGVRRLL